MEVHDFLSFVQASAYDMLNGLTYKGDTADESIPARVWLDRELFRAAQQTGFDKDYGGYETEGIFSGED